MERTSEGIMASEVHLFDVEPATHFRLYPRKGNTGHKYFSSSNPPYGAVINYYLKTKPKDNVKVTVTDKSGRTVRELTGAKEAGLSRVVWDLRLTPPMQPPPGQQEESGGFFGSPRGPRVQPGEYTVKIAAGDQQTTAVVRVEEDPRIRIAESERGQLNDAIMKVYALQKTADAARRSLQGLKTQLTTLQNTLKETPNVSPALTSAVQLVADQVTTLQRKLVAVPDTSGSAGPPLPDEPRPLLTRLGQVAGGLDSYTAAPTEDEMVRIEELSKELRDFVGELNALIDGSVANLNRQMRESGIQFLNPGQRIVPPE
jgi:hypothetical protein